MSDHVLEPTPCPRCGHADERDPTLLASGDHLVHEVGPLRITQQPDTPTNSYRMTAEQDVRLVWCSARTLPSERA